MQRRGFLSVAGASVAASLLTSSRARSTQLHQSGAEWFTNVEVTGHDGRTYRFYDDLLKDKVFMVNFFFLDCGRICPIATQNLVAVQALLAQRVSTKVSMYSISLLPHFDTVERMAAYAAQYEVGPGWLFLTGKPESTELLRYRLGFVDSDNAQDADLEQHLGTVRIANEPMHRWIMTPSLLNPEAIVRSVKRVIPEAA